MSAASLLPTLTSRRPGKLPVFGERVCVSRHASAALAGDLSLLLGMHRSEPALSTFKFVLEIRTIMLHTASTMIAPMTDMVHPAASLEPYHPISWPTYVRMRSI